MPTTVMAAQFDGNINVRGRISCETLDIPAGTITSADIETGANLAASNLEGEFRYHHDQTGAVAAATKYFNIARNTGTLVAIEAVITEAIATGADRTVTIDLKKSTGGAAYASVLSSTLVLDNTNTLRVPENGAITTTGLVDNDHLQLTVAVAGAAGAQAQGLLVTVTWREYP